MKNPSPLRVWGAASPCPGAPFNLRCFDLLLKRYIPIGSMYGIFTNIYHKNQPNVGIFTNIYHIYTIHDMDPMGYLIFKWSWWRWSYCMLLPLVPCIVSPILCKQWLFPFPFIVSPRLPNHDDVRRPMHPCVSRLSAMARLACAIAGDMIRGLDGNLFFTCHRSWELVFTRSRAQEISNMDDSE